MGIFKPAGANVDRRIKHPTIGGLSSVFKTYVDWEDLTPREQRRAVIIRSIALTVGAALTASLVSSIGRPAKNLSSQDVAANTEQASRQAMLGIKDGRETLLRQFYEPNKVEVKTQDRGTGIAGYFTNTQKYVTMGQKCLAGSPFEFTPSKPGQLPPANIDDSTPGSLIVRPAKSQIPQGVGTNLPTPVLRFIQDSITRGWTPADPQTTQVLVGEGCTIVSSGSFLVSDGH